MMGAEYGGAECSAVRSNDSCTGTLIWAGGAFTSAAAAATAAAIIRVNRQEETLVCHPH